MKGRLFSLATLLSTPKIPAFVGRTPASVILRSMSAHSDDEGDKIDSYLRSIYTALPPKHIFSVYVTGGGTTSLQWLFSVPGASSSLMDGGVLYSRASLRDFLVKEDDTSLSCSAGTAISIAKASFKQAAKLYLAEYKSFGGLRRANIFGVSCTAALVSDRPKKGPHRSYVATYSQRSYNVLNVEFEKGRRNRHEEDKVCSFQILEALGRCTGISSPFSEDYYLASQAFLAGANDIHSPKIEVMHSQEISLSDTLSRICSKEVGQALFVPRDDRPDDHTIPLSDRLMRDYIVLEDVQLPRGTLVFPGSFNPLHEGHILLVVAALRKMGWVPPSEQEMQTSVNGPPMVVFEIAAVNADKPPLPRDELVRRLQQFDPATNVLLRNANLTNVAVSITSEPLFVEKAQLFRGCHFLIGSDTMTRLINPKYYIPSGGNRESGDLGMVVALASIAESECKFIVGGRIQNPSSSASVTAEDKSELGASTFETLESVLAHSGSRVPPQIRDLFVGLSQQEFRVDLSSTEIRKRKDVMIVPTDP